MLVDANYPAVKWLKCLNVLSALGFTEDQVEKALTEEGLTVENLTDINFYTNKPYATRDTVKTPCQFISKGWGTVTEHKFMFGKEWTSTERKPGFKYREPGKYQGLKHGQLLKRLLANRLPWFSQFEWDAYEIHGYGDNPAENLEIYMKTPAGSLYVPVVSLLRKEPQRIIERMTSCFNDYHLKSSYSLNKNKDETFEKFQERKKQQYNEALSPLKTEEAQKLFEYLA